jgi:hypothetical protein
MTSEIRGNGRPWLESYVGVSTVPVMQSNDPETQGGAIVLPGLRVQLTLRCSLPAPGEARLSVHDAAGHMVRTLREGWMAAGDCSVVWDQRDDSGRRLYAGVYRVRFEAAGRVLEQKVMLLP